MTSRRPLILFAFHWHLDSLLEGAAAKALASGYETAVLTPATVSRFAGKPFAGIVGMLSDARSPVHMFAADSGKPVVELSLAYENRRAWGRCPEDCEAIGILAAEHLKRLPAASFVYVASGKWWNNDARYRAFGAALAKDKRPLTRYDFKDFEEAGVAGFATYLKSVPLPAAIFASVDEFARLAYAGAEAAGLRVPGDVFILGFGNRELQSRIAPVPLSSIGIDYGAWGAAGVTLLDDMLRGRAAEGTIRPFAPGDVILRESSGGESGGDKLGAEALALMRRHVGAPLSVDEIARRLRVSKATLERTFSARYGSGVARRYLAIRMQDAKARLAAGEKTESVAGSVGYSTYRGFIKAFTKETAMTPGAYAKTHRSPGKPEPDDRPQYPD